MAKTTFYADLYESVKKRQQGERDSVCNLSNAAAAIYHGMHGSKVTCSPNWSGFYLTVDPAVEAEAEAGTENRSGGESKEEGEGSGEGGGGGAGGGGGGLLLLGPFHGKPACKRIPFDRGVCGAAATARKTQLVYDVHLVPGHIACDAASESEIVIPFFLPFNGPGGTGSGKGDGKGDGMGDGKGQLLGVLDLDCPTKGGFDSIDEAGLTRIAELVATGCDWQHNPWTWRQGGRSGNSDSSGGGGGGGDGGGGGATANNPSSKRQKRA